MTFAQTENRILEHNVNPVLGQHYDIQKGEKKITLLRGVPGQVFEFEAVLEDNNQYVGPGDINPFVELLAGAGGQPIPCP